MLLTLPIFHLYMFNFSTFGFQMPEIIRLFPGLLQLLRLLLLRQRRVLPAHVQGRISIP